MDIFPSKPAYPVTKEALWRTLRSDTVSGISRRRATWLRPLHRFTIHLPALSREEAHDLYSFYMSQLGGFRAFKFQFIKEGTWEGMSMRLISGQEWQIQITYGSSYDNPVTVDQKLLIPGTVTIYDDGVVLDPSHYSLDCDEGKVTFASGYPTGTPTCDYKRYYKVVFRDDNLTKELFMNTFWKTDLVLVEVD